MLTPTWQAPDVLVFDCGDTLVELDTPCAIICQRVLAEAGLLIDLALIRRAYDIVEWTCKQQSSVEKTPEAKAQFFDHFNGALCDVLGLRSHAASLNERLQLAFRGTCHWQADSQTVQWLEWASQRFDCYILANWDRKLPQLLQRLGIAHFFKGIYCSEQLGAEKPNPRAYELFLEQSGIRNLRRLYVGNEYLADVVGSRALGFEPVLIDRYGRYPGAVDCFRVKGWDELRQALSAGHSCHAAGK